ncbi:cupin domain-containing protein [Caulobacter sp. 17J65-9]|uniref:helix-turn-helix domain-containing protein n=1 Tax=Caulobacter sp. 17J65-9 TaxID=2709382 RepID=UPI0013C5CA06|nr:cupin domain-containing protein [Caulobacter sp. 17J65-9]NEX93239.1 cupin domain-containing protein [Caulobacter sp. 17J65-9]
MGTEGRCEARPGALIRRERLKRGWTLADASARTGLPVSTLSRAENDKISLTYDKLASISRGLEIDISALFGGETTPQPKVLGRRSVTKVGDGRRIETANYGHLYLAADLLNKPFIPVIAEIRARTLAEFGELVRHEGEEFAYVLEGAVVLHTALYAPVRLESGDSIYFDSGIGHAYVAASEGPCRVLSICTGDEAQRIAGAEVEAAPFRIERYANGR